MDDLIRKPVAEVGKNDKRIIESCAMYSDTSVYGKANTIKENPLRADKHEDEIM
jgi:hypothetical protein